MKQLYFVRHGETAFNRGRKFSSDTDIELTERGHRQARKTGEKIRKKELAINLIIASPLKRAQQTARHIAEAIDYPIDQIITRNDLTERSFGIYEGRGDIRTATRYALDESAIDTAEGVEKLADLQSRAQTTLEYLQTLPEDTILLVGHGSHGRALRRAIKNEPLNKRGRAYDNAELVKLI